MSENHWPAGRRRTISFILAVCVIAVVATGAVIYFAGIWPHGPARADSTIDIDVKPDNGAKVETPRFPFMRLEAQYAGPFRDTVIQRWRDPIDGRVCYLYIPVRVKHEPVKSKDEIVDYGRNTIGSISCSGPVMVRREPAQQAPHEAPPPEKKK